MRLINQSLCMDVPYEKTTLRIRESTILAVVNGVYEIVMGRYSTEEKAYKVMEMVRKIYMNGNILGRTLSNIFIFPKDEDVEV